MEMTMEKEIKEAMKERKILIGSKRVLKNIKLNTLKTVIYASNCSEEMVNELNFQSKNLGFETKSFKGSSRELGEICGKPFNVLLLGLRK